MRQFLLLYFPVNNPTPIRRIYFLASSVKVKEFPFSVRSAIASAQMQSLIQAIGEPSELQTNDPSGSGITLSCFLILRRARSGTHTRYANLNTPGRKSSLLCMTSVVIYLSKAPLLISRCCMNFT
jgi:hypothetical protein